MARESLNFLLQQVEEQEVAALAKKIEGLSQILVIQQPVAQTMMLPVEDPVSQGLFYGGELLVSSAIVRVNGVEGWGMVMDEQLPLALHIAILDGAWAANIERGAIDRLSDKGKEIHNKAVQSADSRVQATRVSFDLL